MEGMNAPGEQGWAPRYDLWAPLHQQNLVDQDGYFKTVQMLDLDKWTGGKCLYQWLWGPLGFSMAEWKRGEPWRLPLISELQAAIMGPLDLWKGRDGKMRDYRGRIVNRPELLEITIRNKHLRVFNSTTVLRVGIATPADVGWLIHEMRLDMEKWIQALGRPRRGPRPCVEARGDNKRAPGAFLDLLQPLLAEIKERPDVHCCTWNNHNARLLVVPKTQDAAKNMQPVYVYINGYRRMVKMHLEEHDPKGLEEFSKALEYLVAAATSVIRQRQEGPDGKINTRIGPPYLVGRP